MAKEHEKKDDINFEITFFEGVIRHQPYFLEALVILAELYTKKGLYQEGLKIDQRLSLLKPEDPVILYNLACSYSLVNDIDQALVTLKKAVFFGYDDLEYIVQDRDLLNLRQDARFTEYFSAIKKKNSPKTS